MKRKVAKEVKLTTIVKVETGMPISTIGGGSSGALDLHMPELQLVESVLSESSSLILLKIFLATVLDALAATALMIAFLAALRMIGVNIKGIFESYERRVTEKMMIGKIVTTVKR